MKLSNRYNIPQETIDKMVRDGVISCSWPRYEELYQSYKSSMLPGKVKTKVIIEVAEKAGISERYLRQIIAKFE